MTIKDSLPDEVLSAHDSDGYGVAEGLEFDPPVLLKQLLAEEDVEAGVSLVGNVDDVGVFSDFLILHFVHDVVLFIVGLFLRQWFNNNASALRKARYNLLYINLLVKNSTLYYELSLYKIINIL